VKVGNVRKVKRGKYGARFDCMHRAKPTTRENQKEQQM